MAMRRVEIARPRFSLSGCSTTSQLLKIAPPSVSAFCRVASARNSLSRSSYSEHSLSHLQPAMAQVAVCPQESLWERVVRVCRARARFAHPPSRLVAPRGRRALTSFAASACTKPSAPASAHRLWPPDHAADRHPGPDLVRLHGSARGVRFGDLPGPLGPPQSRGSRSRSRRPPSPCRTVRGSPRARASPLPSRTRRSVPSRTSCSRWWTRRSKGKSTRRRGQTTT